MTADNELSLRTKDSIKTTLGPYGARKNPATYADEVAGRLLVAAKRALCALPGWGSKTIDLASIGIRVLFRAERPTDIVPNLPARTESTGL